MMLGHYIDITKRIKERPKWFDTNGCPRYDDFRPDLSPNIYADEVVLMEIICTGCGKPYIVEQNWCLGLSDYPTPRLSKQIEDKTIHYGDPPYHDDDQQCSGSVMNCDDIRIIEFWERKSSDWKRNKKFEVRL